MLGQRLALLSKRTMHQATAQARLRQATPHPAQHGQHSKARQEQHSTQTTAQHSSHSKAHQTQRGAPRPRSAASCLPAARCPPPATACASRRSLAAAHPSRRRTAPAQSPATPSGHIEHLMMLLLNDLGATGFLLPALPAQQPLAKFVQAQCAQAASPSWPCIESAP